MTEEFVSGVQSGLSSGNEAGQVQDTTGLSWGGLVPATSKEEELLGLLRAGYTMEKAIKKLHITRSWAYRLKANLEAKGLWSRTGQRTGQNVTSPDTSPPAPTFVSTGKVTTSEYRIHGFVLTIPVRSRSERYLRNMRRENVRRFEPGHKVILGVKYIRVEGAKDFGFFGVDHADAHAQALEYWERFLQMLEGRLDTILLKHGSGFELFYHEAKTKDEFAAELNARKERIVVRGDDGKVWLITDNSFGLDELETVHGRTAGEDMERVVAPVMNNYRDYAHHLRLPTEAWAMHDRLASLVLELADLQRTTQEQLVPLMAAQVEQAKSLNEEMKLRLARMAPLEPAKDVNPLRGYTG